MKHTAKYTKNERKKPDCTHKMSEMHSKNNMKKCSISLCNPYILTIFEIKNHTIILYLKL